MTAGFQQGNGHPPAAPAPGRSINILRSLAAHPLLAVLIFVGVTGGGVPISYWKGRPVYYAECVVYISPTFLKNLAEDKEVQLQSGAQYREFVQQNARMMNRYDIVYEALQKLGNKRFAWQAPGETDRRAAERLQSALEIKPVPDTYQVAIGLEGSKPDRLAEIVNTVADVYMQKERGEDFYASDRRIDNLKQERARLVADIDVKAAERAQISQALAVSSFTDNFQNPYDRLIQSGKEALAGARQKRYEAESQLGALDPERGAESRAALAAIAQDQAAHDSSLTSLQSNLNQRRGLLLAQVSGLMPDHPGRKSIEREIAEIDRQLNGKYAELLAMYTKTLLDQRRAEVYKTKHVEEALAADVAQQSARASDFSLQYQRGLTLGGEIDIGRKRLEAIDERVNFLALESAAPGFTRIFSYARPADVPVRGGRKRLFLMFWFAAILLALAAPTAVDMLDPRIHSANDVERILGFAPLGWLAEKSQATPEYFRDQVLRIAAGIQRDVDSAGSRIVALTSVKVGGGTTTLCLHLGEELARLGVRTLIVEVNAFQPDPRYEQTPGLAALLRGEVTEASGLPNSRLKEDGELRAQHLSVGVTRGERHLPNLKELRPLLQAAASRFDVIVLDAPPLLLSADAEIVAHCADVVLLVVEAEFITKGELRRAARWLERMRPKAAGAIVNRVRVYSGGGYYRAAIQEFQSGKRKREFAMFSPWLWK